MRQWVAAAGFDICPRQVHVSVRVCAPSQKWMPSSKQVFSTTKATRHNKEKCEKIHKLRHTQKEPTAAKTIKVANRIPKQTWQKQTRTHTRRAHIRTHM